MKISIIVAVSLNNVIGKDGKVPWHILEDLARFSQLTKGHHVLMGRRTYESIGKPLPERVNLIITRDENFQAKDCIVFNNLPDAISFAEQNNEEELMIIGGEKIYTTTLPLAEKIYLTRVLKDFEGDTFLPKIDTSLWRETFKESHKSNTIPFETSILERRG